MLDYIDWRGDLGFERDAFNEVDALILAQLSYIVFDNIIPESFEQSVTIRSAFEKYNPEKVDEKQVFFSFEQDTVLLKKLAGSNRFADIALSGYTNRVDAEKALQFSALTCTLPDGTKYIAFRGTDGNIAGWKEDFNFSFMTGTPAQLCAVEYLDRFSPSDSLYVGGHSKGANLAVYACVFCSSDIAKSVKKVFAFDGPGFREDVTGTKRYTDIVKKITAIVPRSSIIGQLLDSKTENKIVLSTEHGILQHFAYTWRIIGKHFEYAEDFSPSSIFVNKVMDQWFSELDNKTRQTLFESIFDVIEASEKNTIKEIEDHKFSSYTAILMALAKLDAKRQKAVKKALSLLAETGRETLMQELENAAQNAKFTLPALPQKKS